MAIVMSTTASASTRMPAYTSVTIVSSTIPFTSAPAGPTRTCLDALQRTLDAQSGFRYPPQGADSLLEHPDRYSVAGNLFSNDPDRACVAIDAFCRSENQSAKY